MALEGASAYHKTMTFYDACFVGDVRDPNFMIHFEAESDEAAINHADKQWESGAWTTSAKGFELRNVATGGIVHSRERRNV